MYNTKETSRQIDNTNHLPRGRSKKKSTIRVMLDRYKTIRKIFLVLSSTFTLSFGTTALITTNSSTTIKSTATAVLMSCIIFIIIYLVTIVMDRYIMNKYKQIYRTLLANDRQGWLK